MDLQMKLFDKEKEDLVTYKRDLSKNPFDMNDTISAMKLQLANNKLQEKSDENKVLPKDIESNVRSIAKFASELFLGQFTVDEAMRMDPKDSTQLYMWHSRALGTELDPSDDDGEEEKK